MEIASRYFKYYSYISSKYNYYRYNIYYVFFFSNSLISWDVYISLIKDTYAYTNINVCI